MAASSLTHRERVRLALDHQTTDRVPIAMVCSGISVPARAALETHLRATRKMTVDEYLAPILDIAHVVPEYIGPALKPGQDHWGVIRSQVSYGTGAYWEISHHPLAGASSIEDLRRHAFPTTALFDYTSIPAAIAKANADGNSRCIVAINANPFESSWYMRGFERTLEDLALEPEFVDYLLTRVTDFFCDHIRNVLAAAPGQIDLIFTADDIGGQAGLLMSLDMWRTHIFPHHARINRLIHEMGAKVIYHTDGSVMPAVPGLIEMGIDILQALQFDAANMVPAALKTTFGEQLCFEGGVSVQSTLPFGTAEQVAQEVRDRIAVLGKSGGYILGPSHVIQAGTPPENVLALFDTALATPMS